MFTIFRRLKLGVQVGDRVRLQFHLTEAPILQMYATKALATDPASRLAVSIKGQGTYGGYHAWLRNPGKKCVVKMNTLVDILEGVSLEESKEMDRRWYVKRQQGTSKKDVVYTARNNELY